MPRRVRVRTPHPVAGVAVAVVGAFVLVTGLFITPSSSSAVAPPTTVASSAQSLTSGIRTGFYLDIGASASLGVQPTGDPKHNGAFTPWGYGDDLVRVEAAKGITLQLTKIGCMGETAESMFSGDHCYPLPQTQLTQAVAFLDSHKAEAGVVSIDLGFNDIRPCLWVVPLAVSCVNQGIAHVRADLPKVLTQLKAAAGAHVHFVGLLYDDPFLMRYTKGGQGPALATQSLGLMTEMNSTLSTLYRAAGIAVADMPQVFESTNTTMVSTGTFGTVPQNVANVCAWTWMCAPHPFGPDDHPNKSGYQKIAETIAGQLPSSL